MKMMWSSQLYYTVKYRIFFVLFSQLELAGQINNSSLEYIAKSFRSASAERVILSNKEDDNFINLKVFYETFAQEIKSEVPAIEVG